MCVSFVALGCSAGGWEDSRDDLREPDGTAATGSGAEAGTDAGRGGTESSQGGAASKGGSTSKAGSTSQGGSGTTCDDSCPAPNGGVSVECRQRFMYGINYAWKDFAADFGGIEAWGQGGVSKTRSAHLATLKNMRAHGVSVVRWWVMPDFRGDGVTLDSNGDATGLGGTMLEDLAAALEVAEEADVYLMPCLFSFDNFIPDRDVGGGRWARSIRPIALDSSRRAKLVSSVVRPIVAAVSQHELARRVVAWDVINEPEGAMKGQNPFGEQPFDAFGGTDPVTHAEMEAFLADVIAGIRAESSALITVGSTSLIWAQNWSNLDLDFYQFHIYDWTLASAPYTKSPDQYGIGDKPVVIGEFPIDGLAGQSYGDVLQALWDSGYAGALGWDYTMADSADLAAVQDFTADKACETSY
jgi:hypothetical protein